MIDFLVDFVVVLFYTLKDVLPILIVIVFFQIVVLKQPIPHLKKVILGGV